MILRIHISLLLAIIYSYFFGNIRIFIISYLFIVMHELSHMIIAIILDIDVTELELTPFGVNAKYRNTPSIFNEFLISIAGPLATLIFAKIYGNDLYYFINICILIFNLIPVYPMDGGRIIRCLLILIFDKNIGIKISEIVSKMFLIAMFICSILLTISYRNYIVLIIPYYISIIFISECKKDKTLKRITYLQKVN